ncbi:MAG: HEAT repeat domain-containing protein, partial [Candidatus Omnitrophota bacterium]
RHDSDSVQRGAIWALGEIKDSRAVKPLCLLLADDRTGFYIREFVAVTLGKIKDPSAVEALITALTDESYDVRSAAAKSLGKIEDPRAIEALITALADDSYLVSDSAYASLKKITRQNIVQDRKKWQEWWEENKGGF